MDWLSIQGVRCYGEAQTVPIRPITLLVGENSSGKSTLLAMVRAAWDLTYAYEEPSFNEEPFDFGGYHAIAYYHGGRGKFAHDFSIGAGFTVERDERPRKREMKATFEERAGQPFVTSWVMREENRVVIARRKDDDVKVTLQKDGAVVFESSVSLPGGLAISAALGRVLRNVTAAITDAEDLEAFFPLLFVRASTSTPRPIAGAPIRSRPERTYNPRREVQEPEGSHVPFTLATLASNSVAGFERLAGEMSTFGKTSGLFSKVRVKRLGKKAGDPFQLQIAVDKFPFNVRDVGYGVSQVLPILVDTLTQTKGQTFLLQQPEVHLHPRAQAALGSLLVEQAAQREQTFVVETHSDHLVDRVRMDVRDKKHGLTSNKVVILYFERVAGRATITPIDVRENGELAHVPHGYRRFFLQEESRLLGI